MLHIPLVVTTEESGEEKREISTLCSIILTLGTFLTCRNVLNFAQKMTVTIENYFISILETNDFVLFSLIVHQQDWCPSLFKGIVRDKV